MSKKPARPKLTIRKPAIEKGVTVAIDSERRRAFVEHLLALGTPTFGNATQACLAAGYAKSGARSQGYRLMKDPAIMKAIAERQHKRNEKADLTAVRVLEELRRLSFFDVADLFDDNGDLRPLKDVPIEARAAIAGLEVARANLDRTDGKRGDEWLTKIKLASKVDALTLLGKHFKLYVERLEVTGDWDKLAARLAAARKRATK